VDHRLLADEEFVMKLMENVLAMFQLEDRRLAAEKRSFSEYKNL